MIDHDRGPPIRGFFLAIMTHKQVLVLRTDLNMRKGKMVAQGSHACLGAVLARSKEVDGGLWIPLDEDLASWLQGRAAKITLGVPSEEALLRVHQQALSAGLRCSLIRDSGLTEFHGVPTLTAVAIGPAPSDKIDPITGDLKLL